MNDTVTTKAPWHLWAVGGITLLWNVFGANDYLQTQLGNVAYLQGAADSMGVDVQEMLAHFQGFPWYAHTFWAFGVWGALVGSLLLLLRSRWAVVAFALSLLGLAFSTLYQAIVGHPEWYDSSMTAIINIVIWSIATFLLIYAISMQKKGVLR